MDFCTLVHTCGVASYYISEITNFIHEGLNEVFGITRLYLTFNSQIYIPLNV